MHPDLNLLVTLDVLLTEGSVTRAAKRLQLSASAMSRALARLRETTGDPLLVRAGRGLVATPRALELRRQVGPLVQEAEALLRPTEQLDLKRLVRSFTLRTSEGFAESFGPALLSAARRQAPGVTLRFVQKTDRESLGLRDGSIDLETGVIANSTGPEIRSQTLFRDRFVGVVRRRHSLAKGKVTLARYAAAHHVLVSRQGSVQGPVDTALQALGAERSSAIMVAGFATAVALARDCDLVASVPERHTAALRADMHSFTLPFAVPEIVVSMLWHPRLDTDLAHRWLRSCLREACTVRPALRRR
ncbi:LysR family transcriptional regulator [Ferrovibrio sp.]|uniref:LysR family transcriptional regulator n=1 Tax=Ferrovibrio sp. TaxID=1917215 RepID=UPI003D2B40DC